MAITQIKGSNIEDGTVLAVDIKDDSITNAKIKSDAAIAQSKLEDLTLTTDVTGTLPVANGGTGATTHTANGVLIGEGTSAMTTVAPSTSGNVLTSDGTDWTSATPAAGGGGDKRNFIIDGDFTQWPEGTAAATHGGSYYPALKTGLSGHDGTATWERSTDVPTQAASGHQSAYSLLMKCTGTDATIGAAQQIGWRGFITGNDFASLHQQEFTYSFWAKTSAQNSGHDYNIAFANSAWDRTWVQTFSPTSTWTKFTFTLTGDTVGTFLFTEADRGLQVVMTLAAGTDRDDGTEGAWVAGSERWASSGTAISNFLDHTSNEFYFTQEQLVLGSVSPDFTSPPIATVQSQVDYYVENISGYIGSGWANTSNAGMGVCHWATKRKAPTVTYKDQTSFYIETSTSGGNATTMGMYLAKERSGRWSWARSGASHTVGSGAVARADGTGRLLVDARH